MTNEPELTAKERRQIAAAAIREAILARRVRRGTVAPQSTPDEKGKKNV